MKIMLSSTAARQDCSEEEQCDTFGIVGDAGHTLGGDSPSYDPSVCTFWCAVAIGSLVKGRPVESVSD